MADFNPQFESPDPSYLKMSKSGPQPEADASTGIALKAFGTALEGGFDLADQQFKKTMTSELTQKSDAAKSDFLSQLDQFQRNNGTKSNPSGSEYYGPMNGPADDVTASSTPNVPAGVSTGLSTIQRLQNAKDQSGKFRTTDLDANLTDVLKDLRNQFPGYRDYIDQEGSKIIGYNPANKLINDKIAQINESKSDAAKQQDFWEKKIVDSGYTGGQEVLARFKQTGDINYVQNWYIQNATVHQKMQDAKTMFEISNAQRGNAQNSAEDLANTTAANVATDVFRNRKLVTYEGPLDYNDDPNQSTARQISDKLTELSINPDSRNAEAIRNLATQYQALKGMNVAQVRQALMTTKSSDGRSVWDTLGAKRSKEIIDDNIGTLYDTTDKLLKDQDLGLVHSLHNTATDIVDGGVMNMLTDPTVKATTITAAGLNKLAPNLSPELQREVWPSGFGSALSKLAQVQKQRGLAQVGGDTAGPGYGGNVYTFDQAMREQKRAADSVNAPDADRSEAIKSILNLKKALTEKSPEAVDAGIKFFFDPANQSSLSKWLKEDYYEPGQGVVKGATGTYGELTSKDVTKSIYDRSNDTHTMAWDNYKSWSDRYAIPALTTMAKTWTGNEYKLEHQQTILGSEGNIPSGTDHHFYYDTDTHQIGVTDLKGKPIDLNTTARINPDIFMVRNANVILKGWNNIASQEGTDADSYILRNMYRAGWKEASPEHLDIRGSNSVVANRIFKAITNSVPPKKEEDK